MIIFKVIDSFSFSETRQELAASSLKIFPEISLPFTRFFVLIFIKEIIKSLCNTHFDIMDFEAEGPISKLKISLKN